MPNNLVIVESPAKAKTITKYLGKGFEVIASMGHVRDLPKNKISIDIKNNFKPNYEVSKDKEKIVEKIKKKAEKSKNIFLATDPDREGEAISWHLAYLLNLDLNEKNRVCFNEITKSGVTYGMSNPKKVDINLVNAQQARRILDRIVGYKLSPFLSRKICGGLSAGRVQSVAVKIIVDREEEIKAFKPEEYWSISADFLPEGSEKKLSTLFYGYKTEKKEERLDLKNEAQTNKTLEELKTRNYKILRIKRGKRKRKPAPTFITSTLQQDASRKLGFQPKHTMKVAQELYEGIEIKDLGPTGLITYMRTDSVRVSEYAAEESRKYILDTWGEQYVPKEIRKYKVSKKAKIEAQDAHEAIRPTMPSYNPEKLKDNLNLDQYKLYKLIWDRFIASQMSDCIQNTTQIDITDIQENKYIFKASGYIVEFDGFTVLYTESKDEKSEQEKALPKVKKDSNLKLEKIESSQHFMQPPHRYSEASLIKSLEEYGIGRPSTYANTISTILSREYVTKEQKILKPTELGEVTNKLLNDRFDDIINLRFTAKMEDNLDTIESGKSEWVKILDNFYTKFKLALDLATNDMKGQKIDFEEETDIICEKCGRKMIIKRGRFGKFISCSGYPECTNKKNISKLNEIGVKCPLCNGGNIILRKTKKGRVFYGCNNYPKCNFASWDEVLSENCPKCGERLYKKTTKLSKFYCKNENCDYEKLEETN
ncbi:MAG: type I DNA topoisomerase [Candidatus Paraimprobicoccus trichonymphae]|uniref:DNA topoisomerase 1 n=1 Tax=Candidatus Paraimprobicoccus trichonymphae TaxID=3033793 RepID=A0AA48ICC4_9FIRM|nr:MAG: type I DNA topoisomerase [Candidatus Paraimprobicoccus trichonymphae]